MVPSTHQGHIDKRLRDCLRIRGVVFDLLCLRFGRSVLGFGRQIGLKEDEKDEGFQLICREGWTLQE